MKGTHHSELDLFRYFRLPSSLCILCRLHYMFIIPKIRQLLQIDRKQKDDNENMANLQKWESIRARCMVSYK